MLSRHYLRSKVLQSLYAARIDEKDVVVAVREFDGHIHALNRLGILQISLLVRMLETAERVMEEGRRKFRPSEEERTPNRKMLDNQFLLLLADNRELRQRAEEWATCWDDQQDLLREAFVDFRKQEVYSQYLSNADTDFEQDRDIVVNLFRYLMNREALVAVMAQQSLLWEDDFEQIAQYNFMMLKTLTPETLSADTPWPLMYDSRQEKDAADYRFAEDLLRQTLTHRSETEEMIKTRLQGWEFERVALIDILLIEMAVAELTTCPTIPERVTIDEYIELSKEFSSERSRLFINGILDNLLLQLRSQGRVNKN